ncbi:hypothetical protein A4D02_18895 [Niastella koreensis]|uniref:Uncharacterized protein n=2 Tax=Niastella koreensis TaxID=354356 RepID=G8T7X7_NIAKG|nr:hypothetical protein [Niastella koreensis]AEV96915.1 hypothetical protein Niako_0520 [Niastella koreensis GR20-10]OQP39385.1 hypothetical protein A4D02_18895 [Niastella koreensis]
MFKKLFSSHSKLEEAIRNDNYNNWESHFNDYNNRGNKKADPVKLQSLGLEIYEKHLKDVILDYAITDDEKMGLTKIIAYFQLSDPAINSIKSKYAKSAVSGLSKQKLADNHLSEEEIQEIGLFAKELNISEVEVTRINHQNALELYEKAVKDVISDKQATGEEQQTLRQLAQTLGIDIRQATLDKKLKEDYYYLVLLNALEQGYLPQCKQPTIAVQHDEVAYWEISSNFVFARTNTTGHFSQSSKAGLRAAKGVSYQLGSSRNSPIREHILDNLPGVFAITNKGVVFSARQQSFAIPYPQLHAFDTYMDGIGLQKSDTELLLQFYDKQMSEVIFKVLSNAINAHS